MEKEDGLLDLLFFGFAFLRRAGGEPAFAHPLSLLGHLQDAPERAEGYNTAQDTEYQTVQHNTQCHKGESGGGEPWPASQPEIIISLDNQGVKNTYNQECCQAYHQAQDMPLRKKFCHIDLE